MELTSEKTYWNILMVDDDEEDYFITKSILKGDPKNQFNLIWVPSFQEALRTISLNQYDAILVDYDLGENYGTDLIEVLQDSGCATPFIIHTGTLEETIPPERMKNTQVEFLSKNNVTGPLLAQTIRYAIERKKIEDELLATQDLLEQRVTERTAEVEAANKLLETLFNSVDFLIAYLDTSFNFIRVNEHFARVKGYAPNYFLGKNHFELFPSSENEAIFQRVVETGEPYKVFHQPLKFGDHPGSEMTYWNWSLQPVKDGGGKVTGLIFALLDVTDHVRAEEARHAADARYRKIMQVSPIVLWAVNREGIFTLCQGKGLDIVGMKQDCFANKHYEEVLAEHPQMLEAIRRALQGEETQVTGEDMGEGRYLVERRFYPEYGMNGETIGVVGITNVLHELRYGK